jgi:hypothetical protein
MASVVESIINGENITDLFDLIINELNINDIRIPEQQQQLPEYHGSFSIDSERGSVNFLLTENLPQVNIYQKRKNYHTLGNYYLIHY